MKPSKRGITFSQKDNHESSENRMEISHHLSRMALKRPQQYFRKSQVAVQHISGWLAFVVHSIPLNMHGIPSMANLVGYVTKSTVSRPINKPEFISLSSNLDSVLEFRYKLNQILNSDIKALPFSGLITILWSSVNSFLTLTLA